MTKEELRSVVDEMFKKVPSERRFRLLSYCKGTDGPKDYGDISLSLCDDLECVPCGRMRDVFKDSTWTT